MVGFLYNNVSEKLEKAIKDLEVGTKLPSERAMSVQYGVSRNVLREALRLLSEKGMVDILPGKGVYVANNEQERLAKNMEDILLRSDSSLKDIVEVRAALETSVFLYAVDRATASDIRRLESLYNEMEINRKNIERFNQKDMEFHIALAEATQNKVYPIFVNLLYELTDKKLFLITQLYPVRVDSAQREHKSIIKAIRSHDKQAIIAIAARHFNIADILSGEIKIKQIDEIGKKQ